MASLYKNNDIWYLAVTYNGQRKCKSLKTKERKVAVKLKSNMESVIIAELSGLATEVKNLNFEELVNAFLKAKHNWSDATYKLISFILNGHLAKKPLPSNPTSRAIHIRHINQCWNWGLKNNLITKAYKIPGDTKGEARHRTYTADALKLMFDNIQDASFNRFIRFAYYTGARSGEIRSISSDNIIKDSLVVRGKSGQIIVKLNSQAKEILHSQKELWNYSKDYFIHKFKKEVRRLGIKNARFHDLRRTFGLNLIKQGMSIYKVSKLLEHK